MTDDPTLIPLSSTDNRVVGREELRIMIAAFLLRSGIALRTAENKIYCSHRGHQFTITITPQHRKGPIQ